MASNVKVIYSVADYLAAEDVADYRSEYENGEIYPMPGVSDNHDQINYSLMLLIGNHIKGSGCRGFTGSMRVRPTPTAYYYPDFTVVCGQPEFEKNGVPLLLNPTLVFEVLSGSTERHDRRAKLQHYQNCPSLQEIVLVEQHRPAIQHYMRQEDGTWQSASIKGLDATIQLPTLQLQLTLAEVYEGLVKSNDFDPSA